LFHLKLSASRKILQIRSEKNRASQEVFEKKVEIFPSRVIFDCNSPVLAEFQQIEKFHKSGVRKQSRIRSAKIELQRFFAYIQEIQHGAKKRSALFLHSSPKFLIC